MSGGSRCGCILPAFLHVPYLCTAVLSQPSVVVSGVTFRAGDILQKPVAAYPPSPPAGQNLIESLLGCETN